MKKTIKISIITLLSLITVIIITITVLFTFFTNDIVSIMLEPNFITLTPVTEEFDSIAPNNTNMEMPDSIRRNLEDYDYLVSFVEENYAPFSAIMEKGYEQEYKAMRKQLRQQVIQGEVGIEKAAIDYTLWFFSQFDRHISIQTEAFWAIVHTLFPQDIEIVDYAPKTVSCKVDSCTWLIRVPSCYSNYREWTINAFQQFVESGCENLIIDVRGNGGGSVEVWNNYFTALYDHSGNPCISWFRNTPENWKSREEYVEKNPSNPNAETIQAFIKKCRKSKKKFVLWGIWRGDTGLQPMVNIHRAAVLIDWNTASAAESIVRFVKYNSDRAKVYGIGNTFGADQTGDVGYRNLPNSKIRFQYPTVVTSDFYDNDFSGTPGIAPDIIIPLPYPKTLTDNIDEWVLWVAEDLKR